MPTTELQRYNAKRRRILNQKRLERKRRKNIENTAVRVNLNRTKKEWDELVKKARENRAIISPGL